MAASIEAAQASDLWLPATTNLSSISEEPEEAPLYLADQSLRGLSKKRIARLFPADRIGIPLSIYVPDEYRNELGYIDRAAFAINRHHRFAPKRELIHSKESLGKILRYSNWQLVPTELHDLFNRYYDKPRLPFSRTAKFGAILLSMARYLPAEAVDVRAGAPTKRELTIAERQRMWANDELKPEQGGKVQRAVLEYIEKQKITGVAEIEIEEFVRTQNEQRRMELGKKLFNIAAEEAVGPIEKAYTEAWEDGLLPRQAITMEPGEIYDVSKARAVPKRPRLFVVRHMTGNKYKFRDSIGRLQSNLEAAYGL